MEYTPRLVRTGVANLYSSGGDAELRADVVSALSRLHPLWQRVIILQAQGYQPLEIAQQVLGDDAWHVEGELLVTLAEIELIAKLNRGRGKE